MHEYPREIEFLDSLPLTTSGKVIRRILRDRAIAEADYFERRGSDLILSRSIRAMLRVLR